MTKSDETERQAPKKSASASDTKSLLRVWLEPSGLFAAAKIFVALVVALLLVANRDRVSHWFEGVNHVAGFGITIDRERAAEVLSEARQVTEGKKAFSEQDEVEIEALGERLGPALTGARILWVDPNPDHNVHIMQFLELFGIKSTLAPDSSSAVAMLYKGLDVDLIVTSSRTNEPLFALPGENTPPDFTHPLRNGETVHLQQCPVFVLREARGSGTTAEWEPLTDTRVASLEFIEWLHRTKQWSELPAILYSASWGATTAGPCMEATNIQPVFVRQVFYALAKARPALLVKKKECSTDPCAH